MSEFYLGAINKNTNQYENIFYVQKPNKYKCVGCDQDLILRKGQINFQSFIHKNNYPCDYFKNPTSVQLFSDAKMFLRSLIMNNQVDIYRRCKICMCNCLIDLPVVDDTKSVIIDYGIEHNHIDMVYLDQDQNLICGFEVYDGINKISPVEYECYQITLMDLVYQITKNLATEKIELICSKRIICTGCE
jgi:hypothetical protein